MSLAIAIQMDPIQRINIDTDSTLALALEAQNRGYVLYHYLPQSLSLIEGRLTARAQPLEVDHDPNWPARLGEKIVLDLTQIDVVLMRQDPPFDMSYITATHLLEHIHPKTLVVNDPISVRNAPEKLFVTRFDGVMPPTLITCDKDEILDFRARHKDIIVKPLFGNGGAGVFHIAPGNENLSALLEMFTQVYREPMVVQRYLAKVREGDKRIILINGEPAGAMNRIPPAGEARANLHVGARAVQATLNSRDHEICATIGPTLKKQGLIFTGIDIIGGFLTEINVTSPTGIREIGRFDGVSLEASIWDAIEGRLKALTAG